jgi:hypothetical protein
MQIDGAVLHCKSLKANCCYAENFEQCNVLIHQLFFFTYKTLTQQLEMLSYGLRLDRFQSILNVIEIKQ